MEIDNISILRLEAGTPEDIKIVLTELVDKNAQRFNFTELRQDNKRRKLWNILFTHLCRQSSAICHKECLAAVRMLSRDKEDLDKLLTDKWVEILLSQSGLMPPEHGQHHLAWHNLTNEQYQTMLEAQKALCNLIYNCEKAQSICKQNKCIEQIVMRLRLFKEPDLPQSIKYFDLRMLFLITAICPETRDKLKDELHGLTYLMETLDLIISDAAVEGSSTVVLNEDQVSLASEVLKVLFNLMAKYCSPQFDEEEDAHFLRLEIILKNLLLCRTVPEDNVDTLRSHIVNLLINMPGSCHKELMSPISSNDSIKGAEYEGKNMEAVSILIDFLDKRLNAVASGNLKSPQELLSPILTVLIECARSEPLLRKYLRMQILPPLRDVKTRPEEGDKLRNKLCRLLTSAVINIRDLVAELLFVLCKENVARMIKYTGYGNAAGMFANRGMLGDRKQNSDNFSSNSDDSDTEEYAEYRDRIDPVIGCYAPPKPDPMASMTEEQKEYEAVKLANMMDKLSREGIVQPCRIGEDGRPQPVDHILQLQEDLKNQHIYRDQHEIDNEDN